MPNTSFLYTTPIYEPFGQALTKRMIHAQQAAFRYGYLIKAWCYCDAHPAQLLTVKEVQE